MLSVPCEDCDEMMSGKAVVCPHCGHRQSDRDPIQRSAAEASQADGPFRAASQPDGGEAAPEKRPPMKISPEEAKALFATTGADVGASSGGGIAALLLPRPDASPFARSLEWTLTLISLPMLVLAFAPFMLRYRLWGSLRSGSEIALGLGGIALGSIIGYPVLRAFHLSQPTIYALIAICGGAIVARIFVRLRLR